MFECLDEVIIMAVHVRDFMNPDVVTVSPGTISVACVQIMEAEHVSSLVVVDNGQPLGIITEKDIARKLVGKGLDPNKVIAHDIMTHELVTVEPHVSLANAMHLMGEHGIKHLPVMDGSKLVGIITAMDMIRVEHSLIDLIKKRRAEAAR